MPRNPSDSSAGVNPHHRPISLLGFADRFVEMHENMPDRAFAFVLGAGASRGSGIKTASEMVDDWIKTLHREVHGAADANPATWASAETLGISGFDPDDMAACYSELYRRMYAKDLARGYAYLEAQMRGADPSYGYSVLARIMEHTRHKVVVTTNFDNLVADSLSLFSQTYPLVCGHESLAGFISARVRRPLVVKVHRDLLLAPKSAPEDLADLPAAFKAALTQLFSHYTPIVIGYGGNDGSLMAFLKSLPPESVPGGVFWCYREGGAPPSREIQEFVHAQHGELVRVPGFDELMMLLGDRLKYDVPDKYLMERAKTRAQRIVDQAQVLKKRLQSGVGGASDAVKSPAPPRGVISEPDAGATRPEAGPTSAPPVSADDHSELAAESVALAQAMQATMARTDGERRWWQWEELADSESDPDKRDAVYQQGLKALPDSAPLMGNYAVFLSTVKRDQDKAEETYKRALAIEPDNASVMGNYAVFLSDVRKRHAEAETLYERALDIEPEHVNNLGNYAAHVAAEHKNPEKAEALYIRALEADPTHVNNLCNYAAFLCEIRQDHDQAEMLYSRAIDFHPTNPITLGAIAQFLATYRRDFDRAEMLFMRSIEADPANAGVLGNYANFLTDIREDHDRAEKYHKRALAAEPSRVSNLNNFANFLRTVRQEYDEAEAHYRSALKIDPRNVDVLGNLATFLEEVRGDIDSAESYYKTALDVDPTQANNLGNYTRHLFSRSRIDEGLAMLDRALAALADLTPEALHVEVFMYAVCHWPPDRWREALRHLKAFVVTNRISTGEWDYSGVIAAAKARNHPDADWLDALAHVCAGTSEPDNLNDWPAWREA